MGGGVDSRRDARIYKFQRDWKFDFNSLRDRGNNLGVDYWYDHCVKFARIRDLPPEAHAYSADFTPIHLGDYVRQEPNRTLVHIEIKF